MSQSETDSGIYYFLGNITSHILHALPLYEELGGTFVVLSKKAKREAEAYGVSVIAIDNKPYRLMRFGKKVKPVSHYTHIGSRHQKTVNYLNKHAKVVVFYELYDFDESVRLTRPKTIFLTHGNMLKDYMHHNNRLEIIKQYDYMAALGPHLKEQFVRFGIDSKKLVNLGVARTDEVMKYQGKVVVSDLMVGETGIDPRKKIVAYLPTFWGASSVYTTGLEIVKNTPEDYTLIFRPHPQTPAKLLRKYMRIIKQKENVIYAPEGRYHSLGLIDIFNASSVIIGDVSSVMLEAILTKKPLLFAYDTGDNKQSDSDYVSIKEIVESSGILSMETVANLQDILHNSIVNGIDEKVWDRTIRQTFYHADGTSVSAIKKMIQTLL